MIISTIIKKIKNIGSFMKILVFFSFFITLLFAQGKASLENPNVYSALGNSIYENVRAIEGLKNIKEFSTFESKIDKYTQDVAELKKEGFVIEAKANSTDKYKYLARLRELSTLNEYFIRSVKNRFKLSIENRNSRLFVEMINSGLLDTKTYKKEIIKYYVEHTHEINPSGLLEIFLQSNELHKREREIKNKNTKTDNQRAKIKRVRQRDIANEKAVNKLLEEELIKKKLKIRQEQKDGLSCN